MRIGDELLDSPRPSLPPLLNFALCFWLASAATFQVGALLSASLCAYFALAGSIAAVVFLGLFWWVKRSSALLLAVALACGLTTSALGARELASEQDTLPQSGTIELRVLEDAQDYGYGPIFTAVVTQGNGAGRKVSVTLSEEMSAPRYGQRISGFASWSKPSESSRERSWSQGICARVDLSSAEYLSASGLLSLVLEVRDAAINVLSNAAPDALQEGSALMCALLCGYRTDFNATSLYDDFKVCGLAHLVAVSGAHLSLVTFALGAILQRFRIGRRSLVCVQIFFIGSYLVFTAVSPSSVRAAVMALIALCSYFARRRTATLSAIGVAVVVFILFQPENAVSVSFILSALSTLSIVVFAPLISSWVSTLVPCVPRVMAAPVVLTLASSVLTGAYSAALFAQMPLIGVLANVAAAPFFPVLCIAGSLCCVCACAFPAFASLLIAAISTLACLFCRLVEALASIPHAAIPISANSGLCLVASFAFAAFLWVTWPLTLSRKTLCASLGGICGACVLCGMLWTSSSERIVMLDVGQGDAFLVQSESACILIDTGTKDQLLREALARAGVVSLDAVLITHGDDDHMGSLASLASVVEIKRVFVSEDTLTCTCDACTTLLDVGTDVVGRNRVYGLSVGDSITVGRFYLEVLWPTRFQDEGGNADSLCLLARYVYDATDENAAENPEILFTGDLEAEQLAQLVADAGIQDIEILKVGHHGSQASLDAQVLDVLTPRIALISVGANNRYGHPTKSCLELLEEEGVSIFRSDLSGDVSCIFDNTGSIRIQEG